MAAVWWRVRGAFKKTIPARVTDTYLASILSVKPSAARIYLRYFKDAGLVDDKGQPTDLANAWRDNEKYREASEKMLDSIYPDELKASAPPPDPDRDRVVRWFMHVQKLGEGAAKNKAAFYLLLASGDLQKSESPQTREHTKKKAQAQGAKRNETQDLAEPPKKRAAAPDSPSTDSRIDPNIQLNIQIHISADATNDQIDAIFASMATHLRR